MLKKLGLAFVVLLFGVPVVLQLVATVIDRSGLSLLWLLCIVSPLAYVIRQARLGRTPQDTRNTRGIERTPILPQHLMEDDE
jgi:hypothetical protein